MSVVSASPLPQFRVQLLVIHEAREDIELVDFAVEATH